MRNAVLAAMAEMVLQVLNGDQLEEAARDTRDQFLDTLQAHGHDVNSFVRSRVLQLFTRIVQQKVTMYRPKNKGIQCPTVESRIRIVTGSDKGLPLPRTRMPGSI